MKVDTGWTVNIHVTVRTEQTVIISVENVNVSDPGSVQHVVCLKVCSSCPPQFNQNLKIIISGRAALSEWLN